MDTINSLIDKLYQQKTDNASPAHLLFTVQMLQSELVKMQQRNGSIGIRKVSVTLPITRGEAEQSVKSNGNNSPKETIQEEPAYKPRETGPIKEFVQQEYKEQQQYLLRKPLVELEPVTENDEKDYKEEDFKQYSNHKQHVNPAFDAVAETQPFNRYQPKEEIIPVQQNIPFASNRAKELHELLAIQHEHESVNDRLKEDKTELSHVLTAAPIKDLKKAIGINERFTLVMDLFKGDDTMYERSIKTINNFHAYSEAEYWINRELKVRLAWDDENPSVKHFYQLVRRRFS